MRCSRADKGIEATQRIAISDPHERNSRLDGRAEPTTGAANGNRGQADKKHRGGSAMSLLLLISAGLELFVQQTLGHNSVATVLLALFLALWSYVLGLGVLLFLAMWWLVEWRRVRVKRAAMSSDSSAGPRSRHLEKPELQDPQYLQQGVAPVVPSRSSRDNDDGNKTTNRTRVA